MCVIDSKPLLLVCHPPLEFCAVSYCKTGFDCKNLNCKLLWACKNQSTLHTLCTCNNTLHSLPAMYLQINQTQFYGSCCILHFGSPHPLFHVHSYAVWMRRWMSTSPQLALPPPPRPSTTPSRDTMRYCRTTHRSLEELRCVLVGGWKGGGIAK